MHGHDGLMLREGNIRARHTGEIRKFFTQRIGAGVAMHAVDLDGIDPPRGVRSREEGKRCEESEKEFLFHEGHNTCFQGRKGEASEERRGWGRESRNSSSPIGSKTGRAKLLVIPEQPIPDFQEVPVVGIGFAAQGRVVDAVPAPCHDSDPQKWIERLKQP